MPPGLRTISLFSGAGGLDLGMEAAGFSNAVAVEMNPIAVRTIQANRERWGSILHGDIHAYLHADREGARSAHGILREGRLAEAEADLLIGGPPCQPFSKSGYWSRGDARRLEDPRASTLGAYMDVLESALPRAFLLENVPGLAFSTKDEGLQLLRRRVAEINERKGTRYTFAAAQLNAAAFGVPQLRERVFVVGHRDGVDFRFPRPSHALPPPVDLSGSRQDIQLRISDSGLPPALRTWDALAELEAEGDADPSLKPRGKWAPVLATIPEGANYLFHTERGRGIPLWGWRRCFWSMLLKVAKDRPSWTLTAQPGPAIGPFHWNSRRFSARELAALQTFPSDYRIVGNPREAHLQLGNAVPAALAELLGREIRRQFFDHHLDLTPSLLPKRREDLPPPVRPADPDTLPESIRQLAGSHTPHPGTGRGRGALKRADRSGLEQIT